MRIVFALAAGLLRMELKDKYALFWMLIMPVAFIGLFGQMFRGEGGDRRFGLTVVDEDGSYLSGSFIDLLEGEDLVVRAIGPSEPDTAIASIRTLTIPAGFSDSLAAGNRVALRFITRESEPEPSDFAVEVHLYQAIARLLANLAEVDTSRIEGEHDLESGAFRERFRAVLDRPDLIQVDVSTAGRGRTVPTGFTGSAQAMLVLFILMNTTISGAIVLTQEKQGRVLARLATLPVSRAGLFAGKILGLLGLALVQSAILLLVGRLPFFDVWWGPSPLALLVLLVSLGLAAAALGIFLGGILRTPEQASAVAWIIPLFLGAIGGCWWPLEVVPQQWIRVAGHLSPAAWAMDGMHGLIAFGKGGEAVVVPSLVLLGYAVALAGAGSRLLRPAE